MDNEYEIVKHPRIKYLNPFLVNLTYRNSHLHNDFELCLLLEGQLTVNSKKEHHHLTKQSIILFNPIQPHELSADQGGALILSLQISPKFCGQYFPSLANVVFDKSNLTEFLPSEQLQLVYSLLIQLSFDYFDKKLGYEFMNISLLNQLFYQLLHTVPYRLISEEERAHNLQRLHRVNRIVNFIEENYAGKLLLSTIAESENLSLTYMSHFFKENLNTTFQQYLNQIRFEKAKQLIVQTNMKLIDICLECGFSDARYLNNLFLKHFGCTPKQYKERELPLNSDHPIPNLSSDQYFYTDQASLEILSKYKQRSIVGL
ncbi:helix-turn-helix transcriptional regulator [Cohnella mopanensis]|uniref:helix-turn-helix transcriptional regulator n=1 Tax=Cohnella mopanensis TaxID=2911966 RepID=UPI001EF8E1AD|nr:AraC family transcriptional regulator [Cohnella mopanensis]